MFHGNSRGIRRRFSLRQAERTERNNKRAYLYMRVYRCRSFEFERPLSDSQVCLFLILAVGSTFGYENRSN